MPLNYTMHLNVLLLKPKKQNSKFSHDTFTAVLIGLSFIYFCGLLFLLIMFCPSIYFVLKIEVSSVLSLTHGWKEDQG